jgi:hypothetical protein
MTTRLLHLNVGDRLHIGEGEPFTVASIDLVPLEKFPTRMYEATFETDSGTMAAYMFGLVGRFVSVLPIHTYHVKAEREVGDGAKEVGEIVGHPFEMLNFEVDHAPQAEDLCGAGSGGEPPAVGGSLGGGPCPSDAAQAH